MYLTELDVHAGVFVSTFGLQLQMINLGCVSQCLARAFMLSYSKHNTEKSGTNEPGTLIRPQECCYNFKGK